MIALKRVTCYLKGTRQFDKKLELDSEVDKHVARLDGLVQQTGSHNRVAHFSLMERSSRRQSMIPSDRK